MQLKLIALMIGSMQNSPIQKSVGVGWGAGDNFVNRLFNIRMW
jgi:hypothetical protein